MKQRLGAHFNQLREKAGVLANRVGDRHIRLAVTGLSRSGKTAFIVSLLNQLEHALADARLPMWGVLRQGRLLGCQRIVQRNAHIPRFAYEQGLAALCSDPPFWPAATVGMAEMRLELRFKTAHPLLKHLNEISTLYLDIVDYPGEWLLDLPLLDLSYEAWSAQMLQQLQIPQLHAMANEWAEQSWRGEDPFDELKVTEVAAAYTRYLQRCKDECGMHLIQPGRFILPGEYAGAPLLHFVPWIWEQPVAAKEGSLYQTLRYRFEEYKQHIVKRFYREHFAKFDRQVVLVDCLTPLNHGAESFLDMQSAITQIMESFSYGKNSLLRRLFAPRIDRILFAATKADHLTNDQHEPLVNLLQKVVARSQQLSRFEGIETHCLALSSIRATEQGTALLNGAEVAALRGVSLEGVPLLLYPGDVPRELPQRSWWQNHRFDFQAFRPATYRFDKALPHNRLDNALEFLLGDKLS